MSGETGVEEESTNGNSMIELKYNSGEVFLFDVDGKTPKQFFVIFVTGGFFRLGHPSKNPQDIRCPCR